MQKIDYGPLARYMKSDKYSEIYFNTWREGRIISGTAGAPIRIKRKIFRDESSMIEYVDYLCHQDGISFPAEAHYLDAMLRGPVSIHAFRGRGDMPADFCLVKHHGSYENLYERPAPAQYWHGLQAKWRLHCDG